MKTKVVHRVPIDIATALQVRYKCYLPSWTRCPQFSRVFVASGVSLLLIVLRVEVSRFKEENVAQHNSTWKPMFLYAPGPLHVLAGTPRRRLHFEGGRIPEQDPLDPDPRVPGGSEQHTRLRDRASDHRRARIHVLSSRGMSRESEGRRVRTL
ncbi:uncharacterized protein LOC124362072 [Homalodisca vitripennis]|uniref:uncharacterized protein LOC124362072 n=1 Tax=Homalodisca vitripennis TaxID=197043 RepID=UPI001EEBBE2D|nr:uncharacterized protein LOC124362072 [Homalodisca vitripennis]